MVTDYPWHVKFECRTMKDDEIAESMKGTIRVQATDIFEALNKASKRLKTFGFDTVNLYGVDQ